jgi:cytochrome b
MASRIPLWDAPVRLFHWTLALLVVFSFASGKIGGSLLEWHMRSGYAILTLLIFRLAWGVVGSRTARFASFLRGPAAVRDYLRDSGGWPGRAAAGHNPLGGWSVLAMLAVLSTQAFSGLFADDEIATQGPLAVKVSNAFVSRMSALHAYNEWLVVALVALHVAAIAVYQWGMRIDLVGPMVRGSVAVTGVNDAAPQRSPALAAAIAAAAAAFVYWLVAVFPRG